MGEASSQDWQDQLQASLRRAQEAIARGVAQQERMVSAWTAGLRDAYPDWGKQRWQRRLEKKLRKRAEREARIASATLAEGYLWLLGAILLFFAALSTLPVLWWLIFPAVGLGSRGTRVIRRHLGTPLATPPAPAAEMRPAAGGDHVPAAVTAPARADPRDQRVDAICDKILAELRVSPASVREIFRKPEETVAALRTTCRDLTRRERDVQRFLHAEEDARLSREHDALSARIAAESDEVTKLRLASALAALDQQRQQRQDLARSASRFEAEHTRISYTLESLHTQVVRMRSADAGSADVAGAGLRRSLDRLTQEMNALADALDTVHAAGGGESARLRTLAEAPGAAADRPSGPRETPIPDGADPPGRIR